MEKVHVGRHSKQYSNIEHNVSAQQETCSLTYRIETKYNTTIKITKMKNKKMKE